MPPAGSPPRGESEKLQAKPAATFGTFETQKPARDGGSGASTSSGEANDDGVFAPGIAALARAAGGPVYGLGGIDNKKARFLKETGLVGLAAVDAFRT